jgi:plasmid stability protein
MKTTLDLPDELVATLETTAAREHRDVSDVAREALTRGLQESSVPANEKPQTAGQRRREMEEWLHGWQELGAQIHAKAVDPRSCVQILHDDRESGS